MLLVTMSGNTQIVFGSLYKDLIIFSSLVVLQVVNTVQSCRSTNSVLDSSPFIYPNTTIYHASPFQGSPAAIAASILSLSINILATPSSWCVRGGLFGRYSEII